MSRAILSEPVCDSLAGAEVGLSGPRSVRESAAAGVCWRRLLATWALVLAGVLPFWLPPAAHVVGDPETASGLYFYELPYYIANGRAAFDRGNGVLYPNPYDPSASAPAIYVHWLPWMLGLSTAVLGLDPGVAMLLLGLLASLAMSAATLRLVRFLTPPGASAWRWYLLAMWGGGLLAAAGAVFGSGGPSWTESVLSFDPGRGLWFLNWGRNALLPTEAAYHAIVATCWLLELKQHRRGSNLCLLLLATTHPWSGLELLLTISVWRGVLWLESRTRENLWQVLLSGGLLMAVLAYYKLWLPSFAAHAQLQHVWELDWSISGITAVLAWGVVAVPAALRVRSSWSRGALSRPDRFLMCAVAVAAGLALHDRFMKPVQPLHFARGYVWLPLFLLALPWFSAAARRWMAGGMAGRLALSAAVIVMVSDNAVFCVAQSARQYAGTDGFFLTADDRALLQQLNNEGRLRATAPVVLVDSLRLNYLLPAYSRTRPWLGHMFNTPDYAARLKRVERCFEPGGVSLRDVPPEVEFLVVRAGHDLPLQESPGWVPVADGPNPANAAWRVWIREDSRTLR